MEVQALSGKKIKVDISGKAFLSIGLKETRNNSRIRYIDEKDLCGTAIGIGDPTSGDLDLVLWCKMDHHEGYATFWRHLTIEVE